jgi:hypothetical protein
VFISVSGISYFRVTLHWRVASLLCLGFPQGSGNVAYDVGSILLRTGQDLGIALGFQ